MSASKRTWVFPLGIGLPALTIGITTGLSASPVVGILIPLLFSLITAGGGVFVLRNLDKFRDGAASLPGALLIVFSLCFLAGLWLGSAAKLHPEKIWVLPGPPRPAYAGLEPVDFQVTAAMMALDRRMAASGLGFEDRVRLLNQLQKSIERRIDPEDHELDGDDLEGAKAVLGLPSEPGWSFKDPVALGPSMETKIDG